MGQLVSDTHVLWSKSCANVWCMSWKHGIGCMVSKQVFLVIVDRAIEWSICVGLHH